MATAVARIFEDDHGLETLILCPKNLVPMWEDYAHEYRLRAKIVSLSRVVQALPDLRRYRLVLIDESHNLRNRQGKRYRVIQEYINENESKCILLTATPYNKTYLDLSNQLRLFIREDADIGVRPERHLKDIGETEFIRRYQCPVRSLSAFEKSEYADDWRELMRLFLVRRTRTFIQDNYAQIEPTTGRKYLTFADGSRSYFPARLPRTVKFLIDDKDPNDQYARLYGDKVVRAINGLSLPRYGLGNYLAPNPHQPPTQNEAKLIQDLSRAGKRLMGFCRTNLFKRLESSGQSFILSIERHIVRNFVYLHAIKNGLPLPIGTQDMGLLDARITDEDEVLLDIFDDGNGDEKPSIDSLEAMDDFAARAAEVYQDYADHFHKRFKWLRPGLFLPELAADLESDAAALIKILKDCGRWDPDKDEKLTALLALVTKKHPNDKVLVFSQFADTIRFLEAQLAARKVSSLAGVTGDADDPSAVAWRFSPESSKKRDRVAPGDELRVLLATDVLSEGQNLQDCAVVVNYDLPWAIIRLVQRVGRVDRIGQKAESILCYTFLPAEGVERIIRLRARVRQRLHENAEVVGTDEAFFEDAPSDQVFRDLFTETAGILDGDADAEVDLASYAYQIWKNAIDADPSLQKVIPELPPVVYSTRPHQPSPGKPEGALVYIRTGEGNDALAWVDKDGQAVTQSQFDILKAAECRPETPVPPRLEKHHELVKKGVELIIQEEKSLGGQLGRPSGARFRAYERLKTYAKQVEGTLFATDELRKAIEDIYRYPLRQLATDTLNRQLRAGISDPDLAQLVVALRDEGRLCLIQEEEQTREPHIICSMGLSAARESA
jgi:superfamily II DNA or RNA helicase